MAVNPVVDHVSAHTLHVGLPVLLGWLVYAATTVNEPTCVQGEEVGEACPYSAGTSPKANGTIHLRIRMGSLYYAFQAMGLFDG